MKPKVFIVSNYYPFYKLPLLRALAKDTKLDYSYISGLETEITINILSEEILLQNHFQWTKVKNYWLFSKRILWQEGLLKQISFANYDCIIFLANPYYLTNWIGILIARLRKKPVLLWGHFTLRHNWLDPIKILFYQLAHGYLLYGNWAKDQLISRGFDPDKLFVVYNSMDYEKQIEYRQNLTPEILKNKRQALFNNPDLPVLLFIGRLTRRKKLDQLIEACARLHKNNQKVNLLLIGDGEEKEKLINMVSQYGFNDYVVFWGESYDEAQLAELISLSDLCISPGEVGLTAIHSLVYGTPVITHNNPFMQGPEFEAVISGVTGMFFEQDSIDSLVANILAWLKEKKNQRELIRFECYKVIDQYYNPKYQAEAIKSAIQKNLKKDFIKGNLVKKSR